MNKSTLAILWIILFLWIVRGIMGYYATPLLIHFNLIEGITKNKLTISSNPNNEKTTTSLVVKFVMV